MTETPHTAFLTPQDHIGLIAMQYGVTRYDVLGNDRHFNVSRARQHCYWFFRERGRSYTEIARIMGRKCHTSVIHGVNVHMSRNGIFKPNVIPKLTGYSEGLV